VTADATAAGGARLHLPDAGTAKVTTALANPTQYFEMTFTADAGTAYRLWIRGRAQSDKWSNDSVHVQFSGSVNSSGSAVYRVGTTSSAEINLEDCSGCGLSGWGWQDNGWGVGVLGPLIRFASTGVQTIRIQNREDGLSIDQILLSPEEYLSSAPGPTKNDATMLPASDGSGGGDPDPPPDPEPAGDIVLYASDAAILAGAWRIVSDPSAAGGARVWHPNAGAAKIPTASASPADYVELTFEASTDTAYRLWIRGIAERDHWGNDSVHVQFSGSVDAERGELIGSGSQRRQARVLQRCASDAADQHGPGT
jgi:hypothetical protein